MTYEEFST